MTARVSFDFAGTTGLIPAEPAGSDTRRLCCSGCGPRSPSPEPAGRDDYDVDLSAMAYHQLQITTLTR